MNQGEEHDKRHFPLSSGDRLKVYKFNLSSCIVFTFINLLITCEKEVSSPV